MRRVVLFGPREQILRADSELEYRETIVNSYEELIRRGAMLGTDYTSSREFLGIECLASVLRKRGNAVRVLSSINENLDTDQGVEEICRFKPDILGISLLYDLQLYNGLSVAWRIKQLHPHIRVVFGGPLASVIPDILLSTFSFIDFIIKGEGEDAIVRLLDALDMYQSMATVPNLVWRGEEGIVHNPPGPMVDLNSLPYASRDVLASMRDKGLPINSAYIYTSRGCKASCTFCTVPSLSRSKEIKYRFREARHVVDEMESVVNEYGVRTFYMADDNFLGYGLESRQRLLELADEILRRKLKLSFHAECRVDSLDDVVLSRLRKSGFDQILLGLESGSEQTLKRWAKGQTVQQNLEAINKVRSLKFELLPSMILLDWESSTQEVKESVDFIEKSKIYLCNYPLSLVNKLKVHCGTAAGRRYEKLHDIVTLPKINSEDDLQRWIQILTYQDTPIENPYLAEFWRCLSNESNRWSILSYEVIPVVLLSMRGDEYRRNPTFVTACRHWRRALGGMLLGLMRMLIDELISREKAGMMPGSLVQQSRRYVDACEASIFPEGIDFTLRHFSRHLTEISLPEA
jgi:anaerobic magnesium-protoporphyrin IX monomethyl ester cyclase